MSDMSYEFFKFIGNEEDERTKFWGIKNEMIYHIWKEFNFFSDTVIAHIETKDRSLICPYMTNELFEANWKKI